MNRTLPLLLLALLAAAPASAQTTYRAPRTASGQPDLQGVWNFNSGVPLQRDAAHPDKKMFTREEFDKQRNTTFNGLSAIAKLAPVEAVGLDWFENTLYVDDLRTSLITYPANGRLPAAVEGVRRTPRVEDVIGLLANLKDGPPPPALSALIAMFTGGPKDSHLSFSLPERCLLAPAVPMLPQLEDNYVQIVQSPDTVVLITDFNRRIIALDGRPAPGDTLRSGTGASRGRWDGDTLVVETRNFTERTPGFAGVGNSREKVVTERFTRTASGRIEYAATVVDPKSFKDRIELSFPMALSDARIHEASCHEHNYSMRNALSAARKDDEAKAGRAK